MVIVVMGVSGCGKSTVGILLARELGLPFHDADLFHPPSNVAKMASGIPLTDADRKPWCDILTAEIRGWEAGGGAVLACSALKGLFRDRLSAAAPGAVRFVYLKGDKALIRKRMSARTNHFMPTGLLDSQFADLEEPADAVTASIDAEPAEIARAALRGLRESRHTVS